MGDGAAGFREELVVFLGRLGEQEAHVAAGGFGEFRSHEFRGCFGGGGVDGADALVDEIPLEDGEVSGVA